MKKFAFKLDTVLKVREIREDQAKTALYTATEIYQAERRRMLACAESLAAGQRQFRERQGTEPVTVSELLLHQHFLTRLDRELQDQTAVVEEAAAEREACRQALATASQHRKVVENLRGRYFSYYQEDLRREEQYALDEMGTNRFFRRPQS